MASEFGSGMTTEKRQLVAVMPSAVVDVMAP
jgi:hypothetical protein